VEGKISNGQDQLILMLNHSGHQKRFISERVHLIKGNVKETLAEFDRKIAFLHIDLDLYEGYASTLSNLWPQVEEGGVVLFDEYEEAVENWPGPAKAINEFFGSDVSLIQRDESSGKSFIVKP
jgi:hypothetical protein